MKKVYLDNASTTQLRPEVIEIMTATLTEEFGNPSSTHSLGRNAKNSIELSRNSIAKFLNVAASEIIFTSGGTEANNWILRSAVKDLGIQRIITTKIEHHAVLHTVNKLKKEYGIQVDFITLKPNGEVDLSHLVDLLSQQQKTLVSLMHVNNEIGTILDVNKVGRICEQHHALFHSDMVQSVGKIGIDLQLAKIHFMVASAHKFHGPKGIGFAFIKKNTGIQPIFFGGEQEKGMRSGTEPVHQIVGMAKAIELSYANLDEDRKHISELKKYLISQLEINLPDFKINGNRDGIHSILNVSLPIAEEKNAMLLFNLDMKGIAVSRGSACQSGSNKPSHVLAELLDHEEIKKPSLRISLSRFNTLEDIDLLIMALKSI